MKQLEGFRVAILVTDGFEQEEFETPKKELEKEGAEVTVVSIKPGKVKGWKHTDWGESFDVDKEVAQVKVDDFDGLVLPGGVMNPDKLRKDKRAVDFVRDFFDEGKPIAAICHGPWLLVEAGVIRRVTATSYDSIKTDMINAGCKWVDQPVVVDQGIITSRKPADIPAFCEKMIDVFSDGRVEQKIAS